MSEFAKMRKAQLARKMTEIKRKMDKVPSNPILIIEELSKINIKLIDFKFKVSAGSITKEETAEAKKLLDKYSQLSYDLAKLENNPLHGFEERVKHMKELTDTVMELSKINKENIE